MDAIDDESQGVAGDGDGIGQVSSDRVVHEGPLSAGLDVCKEDVRLSGQAAVQ